MPIQGQNSEVCLARARKELHEPEKLQGTYLLIAKSGFFVLLGLFGLEQGFLVSPGFRLCLLKDSQGYRGNRSRVFCAHTTAIPGPGNLPLCIAFSQCHGSKNVIFDQI